MGKKSILQDSKACYICGTTSNLHLHHIFFGTANRKKSDKDGCFVYLCREHHTGNNGVHFNKSLDTKLKAKCQEAYMNTYNKSIGEFIERYGKNYIL